MASRLTKKRKIKKTFSRRLQSGWGACPTTSFWAFKDYARMELDKKEIAKTTKKWVRDNFSKDEKELMLQAPEWAFTAFHHIGATIEWEKLGHDFPSTWDAKAVYEKFKIDLVALAKKEIAKKTEEGNSPIQKRTIQDIVKSHTSEFIAAVDEVIDDWINGINMDIDNYSPYLELKKIDAPYVLAKKSYEYYVPIKNEADELINKKTPDLVEAYSHMSTKRKKEYLKLLTIIVEDIEKYMLSKKAVRKVKVPRAQSADKQIKNLKYLKESPEFKLTSINPTSIIGAMRLYTFNAKSRILTEYVCRSPKGFEVKGSTLQAVDIDLSRETKLRKPDEFLPIVMKQTPTKVSNEWKKLTTKTNVPNARINKDTLVLRALNR